MIASNLTLNMDHGAVPASLLKIEKAVQLSDWEGGALGSLVQLGIILGSMISSFSFRLMKSKQLLILSFILNALASLCMGMWQTHFQVLLFARVLVGASSVFLAVQMPVWVDTFAPNDQVTTWMAVIQASAPVGIVMGYVLAATMLDTWWYSWDIMAGLMVLWSLIYLFVPSWLHVNQTKKKKQHNSEGDSVYYSENSIISNVEPKVIKKRNQFKEVFSKPMFLGPMLALSVLFFVVTGIQFWFTAQLIKQLKMDKTEANFAFTTETLAGPITGVILGGIIIDKFGGQRSPNASTVALVFMTCAVAAAVPIPLLSDTWSVLACLFIVLLFGGALMPVMIGLMNASVPSDLRTFGNSIGQFFFNCLGYMPAPFLYGVIETWLQTAQGIERGGMSLVMWWSGIGLLAMILAKIWYSQKRKRKMSAQKALLERENEKCLLSNDPIAENIEENNTPQSSLNNSFYSSVSRSRKGLEIPLYRDPENNVLGYIEAYGTLTSFKPRIHIDREDQNNFEHEDEQ